MKRQLQCLTCQQTFLAEHDEDMPCPACGVALSPVDDGQGEDLSAPKEERPPEDIATVPRLRSVEEAVVEDELRQSAGEAAKDEPEQIVCPRCKLHFVPRPGRDVKRVRSRRTVLVVEDMVYFRDLARDALQDRFEVKTVVNSHEARAALGSGEVDLLLLNPAVGGDHGNGIRLLSELPFKPCPILIYTDADESVLYGELWERLQALGADDVVMKAMNAGESMLRKVAELLSEELDDHEAAAS